MSEISLNRRDETTYEVELRDGETATSHQVTVPPEMVEELGLGDVDRDTLVRESMEFLLERESPSSVLPEFALTDIQRYFSEYYDEMRTRLGS
ncbi:MAG TPA: hypothetical protein VHH09_06520 [Acidimicrobiales bacterium]|nr:hypothetical protein [Acidimicrobiales bacterium]